MRKLLALLIPGLLLVRLVLQVLLGLLLVAILFLGLITHYLI